MIYRTDPYGRFTFVNPVATRILGFDEGQLLSMKYFELMRPDWVPRAMGFYEKAAKTRESTYLEFPVRKKAAVEIWSASKRGQSSGRADRRLPGQGREIPIASMRRPEREPSALCLRHLDTAPRLSWC